MTRLSPRQAYAAVAALCVAFIAYALYLQFFEDLDPCPLCILQRYAFVLVAVFAALGALLPAPRAGQILGSLALLSALLGAGLAAWHVKLQWFPPEIGSCGPGLTYLILELPLARALPRIFQGGGDCTLIDWSFLGLSIPAWAFVWFAIFAIVLAVAVRKAIRKGAPGR
jgi:disulfide bond formation protein DsbB